MKRIPLWISASLILAASAGAVAAADMASVIQARQANYKQIVKASKGIYDALNGPAPQIQLIQGYAHTLDTLAPQVPSWFPAGSGPEAGVKTGAKPDIWARPAEFHADAAAFAAEAHKFDQVAASGDLAAIRGEFPNLGKTCKTCHDSFRQKD